jgi:cytochrome P450
MLTIESPVDFDYDPYSEEALRDPTDLYRELRKRYPAYPLPQYNAWALSRFEDVWDVGADGERFAMEAIGPVYDPADLSLRYDSPPPEPTLEPPIPSFSTLNPPVLNQLRQGIGGPLRPGAVARMEDDMRTLARARLDELVPHGRFDLYTDYGGEVSAGVMCRIVGLAPELAPQVLEAVNEGLRRKPPGPANSGVALLPLVDVLTEAVARRRHDKEAGNESTANRAIDGLLETTVSGRRLTDQEIGAQLFTIVTGGTETVPKVAARCLLELWRRPEQLAEVRADLSTNCATALEETMRFGAPLQHVGRCAKVDVELSGAHIKAGERVFLLIPAANRDEREFEDPDEFIWNRMPKRHFAFGHGLHFCIGVHVARLEGRVLLEELLNRVPNYEIDEADSLMPPSDFQIGYIRMPIEMR